MTTSRKKQNMEIERKKKALRTRHTLSLLGVVLVIVIAIAWVIWDSQSRSWIMNFEGDRISIADAQFMVASYSMFGEMDGLVDMAMDELIDTLIVLRRGEQHGVGITPEEHAEMTENMAGQLGWMGIDFIHPARAGELMSMGGVQTRLMDIYVPNYTPDPAEFQQALANYIADNAENYANFEVKFAVTDTNEDAINVWSLVSETENFDDLIREHSVFYDEEFGIQTLDARQFAEDLMLGDEDTNIIMNLQNGEAHIVQFDEQFIVLYMYDRSEANPVVMEASFYTNFTNTRRHEEFRALRDAWRLEANYTINQRAYATL